MFKLEVMSNEPMVAISLKEYNELKKSHDDYNQLSEDYNEAEKELKKAKDDLNDERYCKELFVDYLHRYKQYLLLKYNDCPANAPTPEELTELRLKKNEEGKHNAED
jgi:hypothetical protein